MLCLLLFSYHTPSRPICRKSRIWIQVIFVHNTLCISFRITMEEETGALHFYSVSCMHCEDAPCVMGCPCGCLYKDKETGFTLYDNTNCISCHSCAMACPYGVPTFRENGKMEKCDACIERQKAGMKPACVKVCPTGALVLLTEEEFRERQKIEQEKKAKLMMKKQFER